MNRRMMMAYIMSHQSRLPAEFQEVEYLESSGTQWIDVGIQNSNDLWVQNTKIKVIGQNNGRYLFGASGGFYVRIMSGYYNAGSGLPTTIIPSSINFDDIELVSDVPNKYEELSINGVKHNLSNYNFVSGNNFNIFAFSSGTSLSTIQLKEYKLSKNGVLVRDFVPCYRKADNEIGLYDLVNGVFYTNAGTGTFIVGGNV